MKTINQINVVDADDYYIKSPDQIRYDTASHAQFTYDKFTESSLAAFSHFVEAPDQSLVLVRFLNEAQAVMAFNLLKGIKSSTITTLNSYGLKHRVERYSRYLERNGDIECSQYCSNEGFIVAAIQMGFTARKCKVTDRKYPNWNVNIPAVYIKHIYSLV